MQKKMNEYSYKPGLRKDGGGDDDGDMMMVMVRVKVVWACERGVRIEGTYDQFSRRIVHTHPSHQMR